MKILDRYIGITIVQNTMLILLVLLTLFAFADFMEELNDIGTGQYTIGKAGLFIIMTTPRRLLELFPMAALIGSVMGLGSLASNSELTVIRAVGVSYGRIAFSVLKVGAFLMFIAMVLGEIIAPPLEQYAQTRRSIAISGNIALKTTYGFWARDGQNFVNIRKIQPGGKLEDINIFHFNDQHQMDTYTSAKTASYENMQWTLKRITQKTFHENAVSSKTQQTEKWESLLSPKHLDILVVKPEDLSAAGLNAYIDYRRETDQDTARYELAFWKKIITPISTAVIVFLAIPFVFGPLRSVTVGQKIMVGSLVGIGFHLFNQTFSQFGLLYGLSPAASATVPTLVALALGIWLSRRVF